MQSILSKKFIFFKKTVPTSPTFPIPSSDGLILPDMAIEESKNYLNAARKNKLDTIFLISPNTSTQRIKNILKATSGFLYLVSMFGTTGMQTKIQKYTISF